MASRAIADFRSRILHLAACGVALLLLAAVAWADSPAERAASLAKLSPEQKEDLLRKKQRFDALDPAEQQRLRELHAALAAAADGEQLHTIAVRYANWLKSLQAGERAEVLSLPTDQRISRMKEIMRQQEIRRFKDFANYNLPAADQDQIYQWLDRFVAEHEKEVLDALSDRDRRHVRSISDDKARRRALIMRLPSRRFGNARMPFPSKEEIATMIKGLSEPTRRELEKTQDPELRQQQGYELVGGAIASIAMPPPSEEELRKFYAEMPADRRARLETMDPDEQQRELRVEYRKAKWGGSWAGGRSGPPGGGMGSPRGPGRGPSPPPELSQPPGFASPKSK